MNQDNMRCQKCGFSLSTGDKFCRNCGASVNNQPMQIQSNDNNVLNNNSINNRPNYKEDNTVKPNPNISWKYTFYGVIIVILIVAGIYFILNMDKFFPGSSNKNNDPESSIKEDDNEPSDDEEIEEDNSVVEEDDEVIDDEDFDEE